MAALVRLERYVESLPRALDSYGTYTQKAVLIHQWIEKFPELTKIAHQLPPSLSSLVRNPPPVSTWIPEAHGTALMLAAGDAAKVDDSQFVEAMHDMNVKMLSGPLYRMLMVMATPKTMLKLSQTRWVTFHRGVTFQADVARDKNAVHCHIGYPTHLFPELIARSYCGVFQASIEASGGKGVRFALTSYSSTAATFDGTWQ